MTQFAIYTAVYLSLLPLGLLLVGAIRKVLRHPIRISRLQLEGALLALFGMVSRLMVFDPFFGVDAARESRFAYWFDRGEVGFFVIGILLFALGFFLERRPRPGIAPWPKWHTRASACWMGVCFLGAILVMWHSYGINLTPWSLTRTCFALGLFGFAIVYCDMAFKRPHESDLPEDDILHIEE